MKRGRALMVMAVVLVVGAGVAAGVFFVDRHRQVRTGVATSVRELDGVPVGAQSAVRVLLSDKGRTALTPELNAALPHGSGRLFPVGSAFTPSAGSWRQAGAYANVTGTLREPGKAPVTAEIGFVERRGRWLVTFEGTP